MVQAVFLCHNAPYESRYCVAGAAMVIIHGRLYFSIMEIPALADARGWLRSIITMEDNPLLQRMDRALALLTVIALFLYADIASAWSIALRTIFALYFVYIAVNNVSDETVENSVDYLEMFPEQVVSLVLNIFYLGIACYSWIAAYIIYCNI